MIVIPRLLRAYALATLALAANAQEPAPSADADRIAKALHTLVEVADSATPAEFASITNAVAALLRGRPEATPLRTLASLLGRATDWNDVPNDGVDDVLDVLREHQAKPEAELVLPIALALGRLPMRRWEAPFALAEIFGADSVVRDAVRASAALDNLTRQLPQVLRDIVEAANSKTPEDFEYRTRAEHMALRDRTEAGVVRIALQALTDVDKWDAVPAECVDGLIGAIRAQRGKVQQELLVAPVLLLQRLAGDRWEVQLLLAETFGAESCIRDVDRAQTALRRMVALIPVDLEGLQRSAKQIRSFCQFLGDDGPSMDGIATLRAYLTLLAREPAPAFATNILTQDDLRAFRLIEPLVSKLRSGEQKAVVDLLDQLRALQPKNAAFALIEAEVRASVGSGWDYAKAKRCLQEFLELTEPDVSGAVAPWDGLAAVRITLALMEWGDLPGQPGRGSAIEALRDYAGALLPQIKKPVADRLAISPDRAELERLAKLMQKRELGLAQDREEASTAYLRARDRCDRAKSAYENARSGRGFCQRRSDLHDQWMTAKRVLERAESNFNYAEERLAINQRRNKDYTDRLKRFGN